MAVRPETSKLEPYLECTETIDWQAPEIGDAARLIVGESDSDVDSARRLYEWVRDEIPHSKDAGVDVVTCKASDVLKHGTGICYAKSHLLAALLRAVEIPAGFGYQLLCHDPPHAGMVVHGFNGVFLASLGRWARVDCRGNTNGVNAQFSLDDEQLAFIPDASRGEFTDERIFASPLDSVVRCLTESKSVAAMWPNLPNELPR